MSPQFTPSDRETVREKLEDNAKGGYVGDTLNGLLYTQIPAPSPVKSFGTLVRNHGWCVTALYENQDNGELLVQVEPIEGVGDDD